MNEKHPNALQKIFKDYEVEYHKLIESRHKSMTTFDSSFHKLDQRTFKRLKDEIQRLAHLGYVFADQGSPLTSALKQGPTFFQYRAYHLDNTVDRFIDDCSIDVSPASLETFSLSVIGQMVVLSPKDVETIKKHWNAAKDNAHRISTMASNVKAFLKSNDMKVSDLKMVLDNMANED